VTRAPAVTTVAGMGGMPQRIEITGDALVLEWDDGTEHVVTAEVLRRACTCASCRGRRVEAASAAPVEVVDVRLVDGDGIVLTFAPDGHESGLYGFAFLSALAGG